MEGLNAVITAIQDSTIPCELWVDGSFVTGKLDPGDSDILVCVKDTALRAASNQQRNVIEWVNGNLRGQHLCHSYVLVEYDPPHILSDRSVNVRAYWRGMFAFSRAEEPKGIALLKLGN